MNDKTKLIKNSVASLLLGSMTMGFIVPGMTTFAKRTSNNSQYEESNGKKTVGYANKKPVPACVLKQIEKYLKVEKRRALDFFLFDRENKYYKALVKFLDGMKIKQGEIDKGKEIQLWYIKKRLTDDIYNELIRIVCNHDKESNCDHIINWFLSKFTNLNEEKFEVLLCAYMESKGRVRLEAFSARNLIKFLYNEELAERFYNKLYDPQNYYKVYSKEDIFERFKEFTQTVEYLNQVLLF